MSTTADKDMALAPTTVSIPTTSAPNSGGEFSGAAKTSETDKSNPPPVNNESDEEEEVEEELEYVMSTLEALGNPWVKTPRDDLFSCHRKLKSYMTKLKTMDNLLRDAGRKGAKMHQKVVEEVYAYIKEAHSVLLPYIHKWIQENPKNPSLRKVQDLISGYEGMEKVDKNYQRALLDPLARSVSTNTSSSSRIRIKQLEEERQKKEQDLLDLQQKHEQAKRENDEAMLQLRQDKEKAEKEREIKEAEAEQLKNRLQMEKEVVEKSNQELQQKLSATQKSAMEERHGSQKVKLNLEQELDKYKCLAQRAMFPSADDFIDDEENDEVLNLLTGGRNGKVMEKEVRTQELQDPSVGFVEGNKTDGPLKQTMKYPPQKIIFKKEVVSTHQMGKFPLHTSEHTDPKHPLNPEASSFQQRQYPMASTHVTYVGLNDYNQYPTYSGYVKAKGEENAYTSSFDELLNQDRSMYTNLPPPTAEKTKAKTFSRGKSVPGLEWYVGPDSVKPEEHSNTVTSTPGFGSQFVDGHLHARYAAAFEEMGRVQGKKFTGIPHEYPIYRNKLLQKYKELATNDPHLLLRYIETTIGGEAYSYIRRAWYMNDDMHGAVKRIWETLESIYGHPQALIKDATHEIKRTPRSVKRELRQLLKFQADLEMFEGIVLSVDQAYILDRKRMVGKIYESLDDGLRLRFETQNDDPSKWTFQSIMEFLRVQIRQVQDCAFLMKNVEDEDWSKGSRNRVRKDKRDPPPGAAAVGINHFDNGTGTSSAKKYCFLHTNSKSHNTEDCTSFMKMSEKERHAKVKQAKHCFICLKDHFRSSCDSENKCDQCVKSHHTLLHLKKKALDDGKAGNNSKSNQTSNSSETVAVTVGFTAEGSKLKSKGAAVPVMLLNAVKKDNHGRIVKRVSFYAFLDCGAERSFCTKELAMQFGKWTPHRKQKIKVLGGEEIERNAMDMPLLLETRSGSVIHNHNIAFIDTILPYAQNIPNKEIIGRYLHTRNNFDTAKGPRRIDMIVGAPFLREHNIFTHNNWIRGGKYEPIIGEHYLGRIWWGTQEDASFTPNICTAQILVNRLEELKENWKENEEYANTVSRQFMKSKKKF